MVVYGLSGIAGLIVGGIAADALYKKRKDGRLRRRDRGNGHRRAVHVPVAHAGRPATSTMFALLMGTGVGVMYAYYSTVYSTIQDVVEPALRGTAMALYFCAMYLAGASLGPDRHRHHQRLLHGAGGDRRRRADHSGAALEPFRGAGLHAAMYAIPLLARAARHRPVRRVAHGAEGRRRAAALDGEQRVAASTLRDAAARRRSEDRFR